MIFRARQFEFSFPRPAIVMGIVNVTPDSFSDGGKYLDTDAAVRHGLELVARGAEILDLGGESTRPGAEPVEEKEELRRVIPVIEKLAAQTGVPLSIDTLKPAVARAALQAGAAIVNDVAANRADAAMWSIVAEFHAGYVCMHAPGTGPETLHAGSTGQRDGTNIIDDVAGFFRDRLEQLERHGIPSRQVVLDVGIGFGKTLEQTLQLLAGLQRFKTLARPLLLGASRKSFIAKLTGAAVNERLPASLACATLGIEAGVQIIRAHDVAETVQAVRLAEAVLAKK
jgi:dihydropteroate synthase